MNWRTPFIGLGLLLFPPGLASGPNKSILKTASEIREFCSDIESVTDEVTSGCIFPTNKYRNVPSKLVFGSSCQKIELSFIYEKNDQVNQHKLWLTPKKKNRFSKRLAKELNQLFTDYSELTSESISVNLSRISLACKKGSWLSASQNKSKNPLYSI